MNKKKLKQTALVLYLMTAAVMNLVFALLVTGIVPLCDIAHPFQITNTKGKTAEIVKLHREEEEEKVQKEQADANGSAQGSVAASDAPAQTPSASVGKQDANSSQANQNAGQESTPEIINSGNDSVQLKVPEGQNAHDIAESYMKTYCKTASYTIDGNVVNMHCEQ